ncbi:Transposon protein, putative, CACTA, En/Spm sub-class [Melia azedarach]|uniref:Transposon protein, putative, CACTA, En/Spm sub-class n=1 Tax=Melia azedarach TaxID=155640 RepID=A0ACC1Y7H6_MELAZ|nr:Transposon protein, putative, CACTA, En/Spm sub-class [Melia azedarach]
MNKSWISCDRRSMEYDDGVTKFIEFAVKLSENSALLRCPCSKCRNLSFLSPNDVKYHLFRYGFDKTYKIWIWHGEKNPSQTSEPVDDHIDTWSTSHDFGENIEMIHDAYKNYEGDPKGFKKLLEDAEKPLYPGCTKYTKMTALVRLYNLKGKYGWSDTSFGELLKLLADMLPNDNEIPTSMYEAKKTLSSLGLEYVKIHACPNDCILYRKEYESLSNCPSCGISRWKTKSGFKNCVRKGVPAKVLWYFPPIPRFKRMFQSAQISKDLTWHVHERVNDGKLRHPADSPSWRLIDDKWPTFGSDPRNLRLALAADGINPYSSLSSTYSCWPVVLIAYNFPPWLCMKRKFMMLSLLISGPRQPGNDIDVYLSPLIDDLKMLWDVGVETYDAYRKEFFNLRAILMWTINDFPAYGNLSGCTCKGYYACPYCGQNTHSVWLKHSKKNAYMGHRRFLPLDHPFRKQKKAFDGKQEFGSSATPLSGEDILQKVDGICCRWGKMKVKKRKMKNSENPELWKKKSIFFELEYWKHLFVRHQLDVMHIEKNVSENIYGTLLNIPGKTKDGINQRLDLVHMGIRTELAPDVKDELKLQGLKSHDCHILMQQLFPLAIRSILPRHVRYAIIRLCFFFNALCSTVIDAAKLDDMERDIAETLSLFEKIFIPSFFDIMVHLTIHLVHEVRLCGPVHLRWMYPFERFMKVLKGHVRNRNRPEGCIAECYISEEALEFCADYLTNFQSIGNSSTYKDNVSIERHLSSGLMQFVDANLLELAHLYVLRNTELVQPYIKEHMECLKRQHPRQSKNNKWLQDQHNRSFTNWLMEKVSTNLDNGELIPETLIWLSRGPRSCVHMYPGYVVNGFQFKTRDRDDNRVTQNSGVCIVATTMQISTAKDKHPIIGDVAFYGVITEIWELDYRKFKIPMFKCDWVDSRNGVKVDELQFTLVDLNRIGHRSDPFILASQAKQVFYVKDQLDSRWSIVCHVSSKGERVDDKVKKDPVEHIMEDIDEDEHNINATMKCERDNLTESSSRSRGVTKMTMNNTKKKNTSDDGKMIVNYSMSGVPYGEEANDLVSTLGVLARTTIPIIYKDWRLVPLWMKEDMWTSVQDRHIVSVKSKKQVFKTLGTAFRNFKHMLTNRLTDDFAKVRASAKEKRAQNIYNHSLGRSGYVGLRQRLCAELGISEDQIDRSVAWKRAHQLKNGGFQPAVLPVIKKIDELSEKMKNDLLMSNSENDILTQSLGKCANKSTRLQGVGKFITPSMYFNTSHGNEFYERQKRFYDQKLYAFSAQLEELYKLLDKTPKQSSATNSNGQKNLCDKDEKVEVKEAQFEGGDAEKVKATKAGLDDGDAKMVEEEEHMIDSVSLVKKATAIKRKVGSEEQQNTTKRRVFETKCVDGTHKKVAQTSLSSLDTTCKSPIKAKESMKPMISVRITRNLGTMNMKRNPNMEIFAKYFNQSLPTDQVVSYALDNEIYGGPCTAFIGRDECNAIIYMRETNANNMHLWLAYLNEKRKNEHKSQEFGFINPGSVSIANKTHARKTRDDRCHAVARRLEQLKQCQLIFMPYNPGFYWVLVVIDPKMKAAYYLDPLREEQGIDIRELINRGIIIFATQHYKKKINVQLTTVKAPRQPGSVECGYYVMRYIEDIMDDRSLLMMDFNDKESYSEEEIDDTRMAWANFVSNFIDSMQRC